MSAGLLCPSCGADAVAERCPCGADLALLVRLEAIGDVWFNCALEAVATGQAGRALEWISACCAARPTDVAALRVQAKLWAQLGHPADARAVAARAAALDPDAAETKVLVEALTGNAALPRRRRARRKPATQGTAHE